MTELNQENNGNKKLVVSNAPSKGWIVALVIMALLAIGMQSPGLRSLVTFNSEKEQWAATKAQRKSLRLEWENILSDLENKVIASKKELSKTEAKQSTLQEDFNVEESRLDRIKEIVVLAEKDRETAYSERLEANHESQSLLLQQTNLQKQISSLLKEKTVLKEDIVVVKEQVRNIKQSYGSVKKELLKVQTNLTSAHEEFTKIQNAEQLARENVRIAQKEWNEVFEDQQEILQEKADALAEKSKATATLVELREEARKISVLTGEKDLLKSEVDILNTSLKALKIKHEKILLQVNTVENNLEEQRLLLATTAGKKGALDVEINNGKKVVTDLVRQNSQLSGVQKALDTSLDLLQVQYQKLVQQNTETDRTLHEKRTSLANVSGKKGELDIRVSADMDVVDNLVRQKEKLSGEIESLQKVRDVLIKEIEKRHTTKTVGNLTNPPSSTGSPAIDSDSNTKNKEHNQCWL